MIEGVPGRPYDDLGQIEPNMLQRRSIMARVLGVDEYLVSMSAFPLLGANVAWSQPHHEPTGDGSMCSEFISDACINPHPKFA